MIHGNHSTLKAWGIGLLLLGALVFYGCGTDESIEGEGTADGIRFSDYDGLNRWDAGPRPTFDMDMRGPQSYYQPRMLPAGWGGPRF